MKLSGASFGDHNTPSRFPCSKLKLDNLFLHWLSLQETQKLVSDTASPCILTKLDHYPAVTAAHKSSQLEVVASPAARHRLKH